MNEKWKKIPGWPYEISSGGRIRREGGGVLRSSPHTGGYLQIVMSHSPRRKAGVIHRLVLEAFSGPRPDGFTANHKDGNKLNNRSENLEWVSHSENMIHAYASGLKAPMSGSRHGCSKLDEEAVLEMRRLHSSGRAQSELSRAFEISRASVSMIINRKTWRHVGPFEIKEEKGD